jgi:hypothetical protein
MPLVVERCSVLVPHYTKVHPDPKDLDQVSDAGFVCFSCDQHKKKAQLGQVINGRKICRTCSPFHDTSTIAWQSIFDRYYH